MSEDLLQAYSVVRSESKTSSNEITAARRHQTETSQSVLSLIITSTRSTIIPTIHLLPGEGGAGGDDLDVRVEGDVPADESEEEDPEGPDSGGLSVIPAVQ